MNRKLKKKLRKKLLTTDIREVLHSIEKLSYEDVLNDEATLDNELAQTVKDFGYIKSLVAIEELEDTLVDIKRIWLSNIEKYDIVIKLLRKHLDALETNSTALSLKDCNALSEDCNKGYVEYGIPVHLLTLNSLLQVVKSNLTVVRSLVGKIEQADQPLDRNEILGVYSKGIKLHDLYFRVVTDVEHYFDYDTDINTVDVAETDITFDINLPKLQSTMDRATILRIMKELESDIEWLAEELEAIDYTKAFVIK